MEEVVSKKRTRTKPDIRYGQWFRVRRAEDILKASRFGKTADDLRRDLMDAFNLDDLSVRTVYRDIQAMKEVGLNVVMTTSNRITRFRIPPQ